MPNVSGYALLEAVAYGGVGWIYRARQLNLGRIVALKVLDPALAEDAKALQRFQREAKAAAALRHPNIRALHDIGFCPASGLHYLSLEYVDGPTLKQVLKREKTLAEPVVLGIGLGIAKALAHAAETRIVHRDVRPAKIMLNPRGIPKLVDLGLSQRRDWRGKTVAGTRRLGSPFFSAPELLEEGDPAIDGRADLYSLGITLFRCLTGHLPHYDQPVSERRRLLREGIPDLHAVDPTITTATAELVRKLCAWKPDDRFANAAAAVAAFEAAGARLPEGDEEEGDSADYLYDTRRVKLTMRIHVQVEKWGHELLRETYSQPILVLGRSSDCELCIADPIVSRRHAQLEVRKGELWLSSLSTTNTTTVNGVVVDEATPVGPQDTILLSDEVALHVRLELSQPDQDDDDDDDDDELGIPTTERPTQRIEGPEDETRPLTHEELHRPSAPIDERLFESEAVTPETKVLVPVAARRVLEDDDDDEEDTAVIPAPDRGCILTYVYGDQRGPTLVERMFQIGSDPCCELQIPKAPRKAAVVMRMGDELWLTNVAPNPSDVRLNGDPAPDQVRLVSGDTFTVLGVELRV